MTYEIKCEHCEIEVDISFFKLYNPKNHNGKILIHAELYECPHCNKHSFDYHLLCILEWSE